MDIVVKPVKCGDCSILYGESGGLLIDCGSDNSNNGLSSSEFAYDAISEELRSGRISDIMISHFHKDHFNGVLQMPDTYRFNTAYLPYSVIDGKVIYSEGIGRLLAVASPRSFGFRLSQNIIDLFRKMEIMTAKIRFLKKGDGFPFDGDEIRVLWPATDKQEFDYGSLPVRLTLDKARKGSREGTFIDRGFSAPWISSSEEWPAESLTNIERRLAQEFVAIIGDENFELMGAMQEFTSRFEAYLRSMHDLSDDLYEDNNIGFSAVNEAYEKLIYYRERFRQGVSDEKLELIKDLSRQQYHSLIKSMNAISIVCDCQKRFLFLGDVPDKIIEHISPSFEERYEFVKIQHHGTSGYYTPKTPIGKYNVISNGGYERRKISEDFISKKFIGENQIICTNAYSEPERFCNYYLDEGACSLNCIRVNKEKKIKV